ncbi:hypothetical protein QQA02_05070 [Corynebacterium sp. MSK006]|uniref:hypothetical protein n=1 Tax=Corynebacterium sp. MSK006 TaxID=3050187 RepID=UPI00254BE249|nr:hypothetical protein [Corynebacterium sp. MSK006]MDK8895068.1 hypothetical protein [Corynebacterium sp. MSK006]
MSAPVLFVAADRGEAAGLPPEADLLVTGVGLVCAAAAVARRLAQCGYSRVVNIGTAGALHDGMGGAYEVETVTQHDFDVTLLKRVSDNADDESEARWLGALPRAAVELADVAHALGFV